MEKINIVSMEYLANMPLSNKYLIELLGFIYKVFSKVKIQQYLPMAKQVQEKLLLCLEV